jgi:Leucine-rich repeat (LRR) protein
MKNLLIILFLHCGICCAQDFTLDTLTNRTEKSVARMRATITLEQNHSLRNRQFLDSLFQLDVMQNVHTLRLFGCEKVSVLDGYFIHLEAISRLEITGVLFDYSIHLEGEKSVLGNEINACKNLEELHLISIRLDSISEKVHLPNLKKLKVHWTNLNLFPSFVYKCKKLESLVISRCNIRLFPNQLHVCKNLEVLDISWTNIKVIGPSIGQFSNLTRLHLPFDLTTLSDKVCELNNLQFVGIFNIQAKIPSCLAKSKYWSEDAASWIKPVIDPLHPR